MYAIRSYYGSGGQWPGVEGGLQGGQQHGPQLVPEVVARTVEEQLPASGRGQQPLPWTGSQQPDDRPCVKSV